MSWQMVTAIGGAIIAGLTLVSALYLFYYLVTHGRGKLRVRLLMGTVVSDIIIGVVALPAELMYATNRPIPTGSVGCNAQGWIYTTTLFAQNLWVGGIAIGTFLLLKHPLHPLTTYMERYSMWAWPVIWGVSFLHSGIWYGTVGYVNMSTLCYYGTLSRHPGLDRDLMQFIPRAGVFVIIVWLYSQLFSFLRRPDTIQLSSSLTGSSNGALSQPEKIVASTLRHVRGLNCVQSPELPTHNPSAPWEDLSFGQIAQYQVPIPTTPSQSQSRTQQKQSFSQSANVPQGLGFNHTTSFSQMTSGNNGLSPDHSQHGQMDSGTEPDTPTTLVNGIRKGSDEEQPRLPGPRVALPIPLPLPLPIDRSADREKTATFSSDVTEKDDNEDSGPSLVEFFLANQNSVDEPAQEAGRARRGPNMSATAYFNRQASLLMLWFPLAYMAAFGVSLVRLIFDMAQKESHFLSLLSSWSILSVGLIDALVFGFAEVVVRRRVRRQMGTERLG